MRDFKMHGFGNLIMKCGEVRCGRWIDGKPHGSFKIYIPRIVDDFIEINNKRIQYEIFDFEYQNGELVIDIIQ